MTCLVTMFDRKLQVFKNSRRNWQFWAFLDEFLSTQNETVRHPGNPKFFWVAKNATCTATLASFPSQDKGMYTVVEKSPKNLIFIFSFFKTWFEFRAKKWLWFCGTKVEFFWKWDFLRNFQPLCMYALLNRFVVEVEQLVKFFVCLMSLLFLKRAKGQKVFNFQRNSVQKLQKCLIFLWNFELNFIHQ